MLFLVLNSNRRKQHDVFGVRPSTGNAGGKEKRSSAGSFGLALLPLHHVGRFQGVQVSSTSRISRSGQTPGEALSKRKALFALAPGPDTSASAHATLLLKSGRVLHEGACQVLARIL